MATSVNADGAVRGTDVVDECAMRRRSITGGDAAHVVRTSGGDAAQTVTARDLRRVLAVLILVLMLSFNPAPTRAESVRQPAVIEFVCTLPRHRRPRFAPLRSRARRARPIGERLPRAVS